MLELSLTAASTSTNGCEAGYPGAVSAFPELDDIDLTEALAEGAFGRVYGGIRRSDGRSVAVKVMHARLSQDAVAAGRMLQEGRLCWSLEHPNVVRVLSFGRLADARPYLVMERLFGLTLEEVLNQRGALTPAEVVEVAAGMVAGLRAIHRRATHRDVKPANIFLRDGRLEHGAVAILDLGIAGLATDDPARLVRTASGDVACSPAYVAPERLRGEPAGPGSDLYSLGVTLYECLFRQTPYIGPPMAIAVQVCRARSAPPLPAGELPEGLRVLLVRLLDPEPGGRPADCEEVSAALSAIALEVEAGGLGASVLTRNATEAQAAGGAWRPGAGGVGEAAGALVSRHFHADFVPEAVRRCEGAVRAAAEALSEARARSEIAELAAARLACDLDGRARTLALDLGNREANHARALAELEALRGRRAAVAESLRAGDRELSVHFEVHAGAVRRAMEAARETGEPCDRASADVHEAEALAGRLRALLETRSVDLALEAELDCALTVAHGDLAAAARALVSTREALAALEVERQGPLAALEAFARAAAEAVQHRHRDQAVALLALNFEIDQALLG